jgi:hypothetical protein
MYAHNSSKFENQVVTRTVPIPSPFLKTSIKLPQAGLARLQEMRPVSVGNCGRPLDHCSNIDRSLRFSERVRCTG